MARLLTCALLLLSVGGVVFAGPKMEVEGGLGGVGDVSVVYNQPGYTREAWIGLPPEGVTATEMFQVMSKVCDDTTAVAVIEPSTDDVDGTKDELSAVRSVLVKRGLSALREDIDTTYIRLVLVGMFESCQLALQVAQDGEQDIGGVALIDPPVWDLETVETDHRAGVDVLLHPRSDGEFAKEEAELVKRLGSWGPSSRVIRSENRTGYDLADSLVEVRNVVRNPIPAGDERLADIVKTVVGGYDVVMVGELHGNPGAHRVQLEILRAMHAAGQPFALSTEQWERDTQAHVDAYLADEIDEAEFIEKSRAWPNYADYRPLIEFCKKNNIPVIAGNIPRRLASRIFKEGVESFEEFSDEEKSWTARELKANPGAYKDQFFETMGEMGVHDDKLESMYAAQCIKDDTMAESIADYLKANPDHRVLHINGAFHSGGGLGVPEKLNAMTPDKTVALVTCVNEIDEEPAQNEWLIKVPAPRPMRQVEARGH